jgi:Plasmid pRiA4b ORF-3-like protein
MPTPTFPGTCSFCGETFTTRTIKRHLANCNKRQAAESKTASSKKAKTVQLYQLRVEGYGIFGKYWMYVEAPADATLRHLDQFLRDTWLECCGHLSAFEIAGQRYSVSPMNDAFFGLRELGMSAKLRDVLRPGLKFDYEYDFGTTSELTLHVIGEREQPQTGRAVQVLARNTAPEIQCEGCKQALAAEICVDCLASGEEDPVLFCQDCATEHEHDDMLLPIVNSPRTGLCDYTG